MAVWSWRINNIFNNLTISFDMLFFSDKNTAIIAQTDIKLKGQQKK
ncbi:MAG TPA: hypothetical protein PLM71_07420 [Syntrophorhabdaceae bacterium]|nr:hypothetical protein [Syntrophorhabdaceae bacterium]HPU30134.1 hypothetical protein [Syntrophorhabdaceae bacterium]